MLEKYINLLYGMSTAQAVVQFFNCHHGRHVTVQMDGYCVYCNAHVSGNPLASPNNPPAVSKAALWRKLRGK
jgi:hypothetical protein